MSSITKPMLAATQETEKLEKIKYPMFATQKIDGIRCLKLDGEVKSRTLKKIPNLYIRNELNRVLGNALKNSRIFSGEFDGEIVASTSMNFQETTHNVMSFEGEPDFVYYVFDVVENDLKMSYENRIELLKAIEFNDKRIVKLLPTKINNEQELLAFEEEALSKGFEGVILRSCSGPYKCGRSTLKEGYLSKMKRFTDSEAVITGFEELEQNNNVATKDALGHSERSSCKAGMVGKNTLGTLLATDIYSGLELRIGSGLTDIIRAAIWADKETYLGMVVKYKYFSVGVKDKPRHPVFLGFRHKDDMGE